MGAPNATEIPAAAAAERTSRLRAVRSVNARREIENLITYLHYLSGFRKVSLKYSRSSMQHAQVGLLYLAIDRMQQRDTDRC